MQSKSISRELALLVLGQISETKKIDYNNESFEVFLNKALSSLMDHWREVLDDCALKLESAQQHIIDSELHEGEISSSTIIREHLNSSLMNAEQILNGLSASIELPRLLALSDQEEIRLNAMKRVELVIQKKNNIDNGLDEVMEGWRLKRLPRLDRDILRLAVVDLIELKTPAAVACNEAVDLANKYSDMQGRRMINGVLRRIQTSYNINSL